jgi:hypothetical protein
MTSVVEAPVEFMESLATMRFPNKMDARLQRLMDRNTNGELSDAEREELESLAELSETISLHRARALQLLGRSSA